MTGAPALLRGTRAHGQAPPLRVGHVSPRTGPLAGFAEADDHVLTAIQAAFAGGLEDNGKTWTVEITSKDSQPHPNRAAEGTADLSRAMRSTSEQSAQGLRRRHGGRQPRLRAAPRRVAGRDRPQWGGQDLDIQSVHRNDEARWRPGGLRWAGRDDQERRRAQLTGATALLRIALVAYIDRLDRLGFAGRWAG